MTQGSRLVRLTPGQDVPLSFAHAFRASQLF